jgi:hypothetical protein
MQGVVKCTGKKGMDLHFKASGVEIDSTECNDAVCSTLQALSQVLNGLHYTGSTRASNSTQLDIHFEGPFVTSLKTGGWHVVEDPSPEWREADEHWGHPKADLLIHLGNSENQKAILEIEKANKKTVWFDFIKLWMFLESEDIGAGVLVCPSNYAHKSGVWNVFEDACRYKRLLARFAGVPREKLRAVGILGYMQLIERDGDYRRWDRREFEEAKRRARG